MGAPACLGGCREGELVRQGERLEDRFWMVRAGKVRIIEVRDPDDRASIFTLDGATGEVLGAISLDEASFVPRPTMGDELWVWSDHSFSRESNMAFSILDRRLETEHTPNPAHAPAAAPGLGSRLFGSPPLENVSPVLPATGPPKSRRPSHGEPANCLRVRRTTRYGSRRRSATPGIHTMGRETGGSSKHAPPRSDRTQRSRGCRRPSSRPTPRCRTHRSARSRTVNRPHTWLRPAPPPLPVTRPGAPAPVPLTGFPASFPYARFRDEAPRALSPNIVQKKGCEGVET